ncbi:hypothetical protein AA0117_g9235 [Alternaria alternata]|uniref:Uncharacterized protein n=1 Tax=Alternaria alternata TaxID=5599 RepID=A0A4Q4N7H4_ALTAL|nr:uncharacterized protein J4E82_006905 [Alternaria postmessia]KAI5374337.1 hypothetical protein J4E82_006905 [Alternaria postmessia]RYN71786.1 hypothetical protein AA0117_g9235 [Alternaria alternata]
MARLSTPATKSKTPKPSASNNGQHAPCPAHEAALRTLPRQELHRPTKQASYELANHAKAYLEGGQYASGYDFLHSLLAAGTSISTPAKPYIGFLAPPAYIAFASSTVVDPKFTTKAQSQDAVKGSNAALRYLQCVRTTIDGPAYPTIKKAFTFPDERNRRRAPAKRTDASSSPEPAGDIERIAGEAANQKSLWYRADDFWHIVGWSFNCAIIHKKRWSRWKLWLANMLDFLEADWHVCVKQSKLLDGTIDSAALQQSLVWHYIIGHEGAPMSRSRRRRMVKAILATATSESLKEYPEIWDKETVELRRKKGECQPVRDIDFETGELADYGSDEDMQDAPEDSDSESTDGIVVDTSGQAARNTREAIEHLGGQDAIELRQRLIALLVRVAEALPAHFTPLFDLCDTILEDFSALPTVIFQVLLSTMKLPHKIRLAFTVNLLHPLITGKPPNYFIRQPTQEDFEEILLPLRGTTKSFAANAKISLILEQVVLRTMEQQLLKPTDALREAMESGIDARNKVFGTGKGKRGNAEEENIAKKLLHTSSERLLGLLEVLEMQHGKKPRPMQGNNKRRGGGERDLMVSFGSNLSSLSSPPSSTENDTDAE